MSELDSIDIIDVTEKGFIIDINKFVGDVKTVVPNRTIVVDKYDFTIKELIIYIMNGLYALKQEGAVAWLAVFGQPYIVSLRKFAIPNEKDTIKVCNIIRDSLLCTIDRNAVNTLMNPVIVDIQRGVFRYEK